MVHRRHTGSTGANGEQTGRTLAGTAYSLSFDYDGQLTQITQGGKTTSFAYDALGRRYSRTAGGTTTQFHYAGSAVPVRVGLPGAEAGSTRSSTAPARNGPSPTPASR